jgi:O-antigen/teichoic acid export membrane protein
MRREILNSLVNYASTIYIIILSFFCNLVYFRYFGSENYALVGLVALITTIINLFDFGFSATLLREVAATKNGIYSIKINNIINSIEFIFIFICFLLVPCIFFYIVNLPEGWVYLETEADVNFFWIALVVSLYICTRFVSNIYRCGIIGTGRLIQYNIIIFIFNSLRYFLTVLYLVYISNEIFLFFIINLLISLMELIVLRGYFLSKIFLFRRATFKSINWNCLKAVLPYSLGIGVASIFITFFSSADKILLSNSIDARHFGYYSLMLLISSSMVNIATPVLISFMPKLVSLVAENKIDLMYSTYRFMTRTITLVLTMTAVYLATFSGEILYLISGSNLFVDWTKNIFIFHLFGSVFFIINSFQYYLQNALGRYKVHLMGSVISLVIFVPFLYFLFSLDGALGASKAWLFFNLFWLITWNVIVYLIINSKFFSKWMIFDIAPILIYSFISYFFLRTVYLFNFSNVFYTLFLGALILVAMLFFGLLSIDQIRKKILILSIP